MFFHLSRQHSLFFSLEILELCKSEQAFWFWGWGVGNAFFNICI